MNTSLLNIKVNECCAHCGIHFDDNDTCSVTNNELCESEVCLICAQIIIDCEGEDTFPSSYKTNVKRIVESHVVSKEEYGCEICGEISDYVVLYICEGCKYGISESDLDGSTSGISASDLDGSTDESDSSINLPNLSDEESSDSDDSFVSYSFP